MFKWIERFLFFITQKIVLLIVFLVLFLIGLWVYQNINLFFNTKNTPNIKFTQYSDLIQSQNQTKPTSKEHTQSQKALFNTYVQNIVSSLSQLPDKDIDKTDLSKRIEFTVKIKSYIYPPDLQLSYAKSLAKLTQDMVKMEHQDIYVDKFFKWYDQEFARQVEAKKQHNTNHHIAGINTNNAYVLFLINNALGVLLLLVTILAILRIEKNTRKQKSQ